VIAVVVLALVGLLLKPLWTKERSLRFWVIGALLSVFPACATFPADRLLSWVGIGASAALAIVFNGLIQPSFSDRPWPRRSLFAELAALAIVVFHLVIAPFMLPWRSTGVLAIRTMLERADNSLPRSPEIREQTFIYVNPPNDAFAGYIPIMRADRGQPRPKAQRWLTAGVGSVEFERLDAQSVRIRQAHGYLAAPSERLLRGPRNPFRVGDTVSLPGMRARITKLTPDQRPLEVTIVFDVPLEHRSLRWFYWAEDRYAPFTVPPIGHRVTLPETDLLKVAYGSD
jgi:hypothetical protein